MPRGFRAFEVKSDPDAAELFLVPAQQGRNTVPLEYPSTRARCLKHLSHRSPDADCTCGYHAYEVLGGAADYVESGAAWVMAEVWGYGRVEQHLLGWRSEKMQIVAFFYPFCDVDGCREPATVWDQGVPSFPCPLMLRCEAHSPRDVTERPVAEFIKLLADKFDAAVYDVDATLAVFDQEAGWRLEIAERSPQPSNVSGPPAWAYTPTSDELARAARSKLFTRPIQIWYVSYAVGDGKTASMRSWDVIVNGPKETFGPKSCRCDPLSEPKSGWLHKLFHVFTSCWHYVLTKDGVSFQYRVSCWKCGALHHYEGASGL